MAKINRKELLAAFDYRDRWGATPRLELSAAEVAEILTEHFLEDSITRQAVDRRLDMIAAEEDSPIISTNHGRTKTYMKREDTERVLRVGITTDSRVSWALGSMVAVYVLALLGMGALLFTSLPAGLKYLSILLVALGVMGGLIIGLALLKSVLTGLRRKVGAEA